ncbi:hypothetical protein DIPPA_03814 [Diplonema papillatum]|nr:hypothetical protein DIPPA_03814 [Diplonema papillatum]
MSFARAFQLQSLDGKNTVYTSNVFTSLWEREGESWSAQDKAAAVREIAKAATDDASQKLRYGDEASEGVIPLYDETEDLDDETEGLMIVWKQLKGTAFVLAVPESANVAVASHIVTTLIKLGQYAYGHKGLEFEVKDVLLKPEVMHVVVSKTIPDGLLTVIDTLLLKQSIKKALDGLK